LISPRCRQTRAGAAPCPWSTSPPSPSQRLLQVAASLLAWWNAKSCRGFDLTDLSPVGAIARDMLATAAFIATHRDYPAAYGLGPQFEQLVA